MIPGWKCTYLCLCVHVWSLRWQLISVQMQHRLPLLASFYSATAHGAVTGFRQSVVKACPLPRHQSSYLRKTEGNDRVHL